MQDNHCTGLQTPERFDASTERLTDCPVCGEPIDGLAADDRTTIEPCGHSAEGLTTTQMTTRDTTSDAHRLMTDGGKVPAIDDLTDEQESNILASMDNAVDAMLAELRGADDE